MEVTVFDVSHAVSDAEDRCRRERKALWLELTEALDEIRECLSVLEGRVATVESKGGV